MLEQTNQIARTISGHLNRSGNADAAVDVPAWVTGALEACKSRVDLTRGGFSGAPKFPPHQTLLLWITLLEQQAAGTLNAAIKLSDDISRQVRSWLTITLDNMAAGGIYDQIGGGFSRHSTDEQWLVPHFEKMLYDNAQLALIYARAGVLLPDHDSREDPLGRDKIMELYRFSASDLGDFLKLRADTTIRLIDSSIADAGWAKGQDFILLHTLEGRRSIASLASRLGITVDRTNAALVPEISHMGCVDQLVSLDIMRQVGKFQAGNRIVMSAIATGMKWGCCLFECEQHGSFS